MNASYLPLWPIIAALGAIGGVWLNSKINPGVRPTRRPSLTPVPVATPSYRVVRVAPRR